MSQVEPDKRNAAPVPERLFGQTAWTRRLARGLVGDGDVADDVVQDVWVAAARRPPATDVPVEPWLRKVVRRTFFNRHRQDKRRAARERAAVRPDDVESPESLLARWQTHKILVELVSALEEPYRQTVLLRYFEGLSSARIAERQGIPPGTVRSRLKTAIDGLRASLNDRYQSNDRCLGVLVAFSSTGGAEGSGGVGVHAAVFKWIAGAAIGASAWIAWSSAHRADAPPIVSTERQEIAPVSRAGVRAVPMFSVPSPPGEPERQVRAASALVPSAGSPARAAGVTVGATAAPPPSILGTVKLAGELPTPRKADINMSSDPFCAKHGSAPDEEVIVGPERGLANVVVRIARGGSVGGLVPTEEAVLNQRGCSYSPRVLVAQIGQVISIRNDDQTLHNVHTYRGPSTLFNQAQPAGFLALKKRFSQTGDVIRFGCDVHPWMRGYVIMTDNPAFAVTAADGRYSLRGLPPGRYTVEAWHERFGTRTAEAVVTPTKVTELGFSFGDDPAGKCRIAVTGESPIAQACRAGGIKRAKVAMKAMVKAAKEKGMKRDCEDCHAEDGLRLTDTARRDFEELAAQASR